MNDPDHPEIVLARHAETEWTMTGQHTGRTDIPLTAHGEQAAVALAAQLRGRQFGLVLSSPLMRAQATCRLTGFGERAQIREDLREWDYGDYEGLTTAQILERDPGWDLWRDGVPGGESPSAVAERADRVIEEALAAATDTLCFSHGHLLRVLAARWLEHPPALGARLVLSPGALCTLGWERERRVLRSWNKTV
jgi:broad specificity phosphatase PhoE